MTFHVRPVRPEDFFSWFDLYCRYAQHDEDIVTDEKTLQVWAWINDPNQDLEAFIACNAHGETVALAHAREFLVPIDATKGIDLDSVVVKENLELAPLQNAFKDFFHTLAQNRRYSVIRHSHDSR